MKIKTSELIGNALNAMVAKCAGVDYETAMIYHNAMPSQYPAYDPSTNGALATTIIEREKIDCDWWDVEWAASQWNTKEQTGNFSFGSTMLIAAMRCYVANKLGDVVDVPDEFI